MADYSKSIYSKRFGRITLLETNVRNYSSKLFYKFVKVEDGKGNDISSEFADFYGFKTTKRKGFFGYLMNSGYGFLFIDYIHSKMKAIDSNTLEKGRHE